MADIDFLKRQYYVSALGLTEAQAVRMTINDLEFAFFSTSVPSTASTRTTRPNTDDRLVEAWDGTAWVPVFYDSGLRNITSLATNNWGAGTLFVRRINSTVFLYGSIRNNIDASPVTSFLPLTFATGFQQASSASICAAYNSSTGTTTNTVLGNGSNYQLFGTRTQSQSYVFELTFSTTQVIPTALPGTLVLAAL